MEMGLEIVNTDVNSTEEVGIIWCIIGCTAGCVLTEGIATAMAVAAVV